MTKEPETPARPGTSDIKQPAAGAKNFDSNTVTRRFCDTKQPAAGAKN